MASLLQRIGRAADAILPGDQSRWHKPAPRPQQRPTPGLIQRVQAGVGNFAQGAVNNVAQHPERILPPVFQPAVDASKFVINHAPQITHTAQQIPRIAGHMASEAVKAPVNAIASPIESIIGLTESDPRMRAAILADAERRNPIARSGGAYADAARDVQAGRNPGSNLLKGTGEATNLIASSLPLNGFATKQGAKLLPRIADASIKNAGLVGAIGASQGAMTGDPKEVLKQGLIGAGMGVGLGVGGTLLARGGSHVVNDPLVRNEHGYIATPDSVNFNKYVKQGKPVTTFPDGLKGVEISDKKMKVKPQGVVNMIRGGEVHIDDVLDHKLQKADYPFLYSKEGTGGVKVKFDNSNPNARAFFDDSTNTVHVNPDVFGNTPERMIKSMQSNQGRSLLAHEISHAIDSYSGVRGSTPGEVRNALRVNTGQNPTDLDVWRNYNRTPSEQRALLQEGRINMSQKEIDKNPMLSRPEPFRLPGSGKGVGDRFLAARNNPQAKGSDGKYVKGEDDAKVLETLFPNPKHITPIKLNGKTVGGVDATPHRGDSEVLRIHHIRILPEAQGNGLGRKTVNQLFQENPNAKRIIGNATDESRPFWKKMGANFSDDGNSAFSITRPTGVAKSSLNDTMAARKGLYATEKGKPSSSELQGLEEYRLNKPDNISSLSKAREYNPATKELTVYRVVPEGKTIGKGDYVFDNKAQAEAYLKQFPERGTKIVSTRGKLEDFIGIGAKERIDGLGELIYNPVTASESLKAVNGLKMRQPGASNKMAAMKDPRKALGLPKASEGVKPPIIKQNRFSNVTVQKSPEVSAEVKSQVSGQHVQRNTKDLVTEVQRQIKDEGLEPTLNRTLKELSVPNGQTSDETLARAIELAKHHDSIGTPASQDIAASLYDQVAEHGVGKGQGSQILSMLARRSPAGLRNKAFKDLKKAGVEVTPGIKKEIQGHIDTIRGMEDGAAKDYAIAVLQKAVQKHIPQGFVENGVSLWKAGLLSGVKTQGGNFISNATFGTLRRASDPISTLADKAISLGTKQRTKAVTAKGNLSGTVQGIKSGVKTLKTGIDQRNMGDKYEQHAEINMRNKAMQKVFGGPANLVFRSMNASDQPFYYSSLKNSLYDQAKADGINKGLSGKDLRLHMDRMVQDPPEQMVETATFEASKAVLGYDTFASKAVAGLKKGIDNTSFSPAGKKVAVGVVNVLAPFVRVPSAFLSRTVDFTPLGVGKEVFSQIANKKFNQRQLSQAIGEGITGTGILALGAALTHADMLSGDYPKQDPKESARWKAEGITPNSIKLGDKWISLNYIGPLGLLFRASNKMVKTAKEGGDLFGTTVAGTFGLGQGILGQSFTQGLSGFSDAIKDPERSAASYYRSQIASLIPSWSNDLGNLSDPMQRQVNSMGDAIKGRTIFRKDLMVKKDSFGNPLDQAAGSGLQAAINPLKPSKDRHTPLLTELDRLKGTGKENFVFPTTDKTIEVGNQVIKLDPKQQDTYNTSIGQLTQKTWNEITTSAEYKGLSDNDKADALRRSMQDISAVGKAQMLESIGKKAEAKQVADNMTKRQYDMLTGGTVSAADYAVAKDTKTGRRLAPTNPKSAYEQAVKGYERDKAKMSPAQRYKTEKELFTLNLKKDYEQDVVDLYGMSKGDLANLFNSNPELRKYQDKVLDLDNKIASAKGAKLKFGGTLAYKAKGGRKASGRKGGRAPKLPNYSKMIASTSNINRLLRSSKVKKVSAPKTSKPKIAKTRKISTNTKLA